MCTCMCVCVVFVCVVCVRVCVCMCVCDKQCRGITGTVVLARRPQPVKSSAHHPPLSLPPPTRGYKFYTHRFFAPRLSGGGGEEEEGGVSHCLRCRCLGEN